jgi:chemotaxis protein MotB
MKGTLSKVGMVALFALMLSSQGCQLWSKYQALKRKYDEAVRELAAKDSQLADANTRIDQLRDTLKAKDQLIALYEEKYKDAGLLAQRTREDLDRLAEKLKGLEGLGEGIEVKGTTVIMPDKLLFATGSADVSEAGRKVLEEVANRFKGGAEVLQIDGHTDDVRVARPDTVKKFENNWGLAAFRSKAVLEILAKGGIAENRMFIRAFSMFRPRLPNTNDASRSKNRRVEIMFFPPEAAIPKATAPKPEEPKPEAPKPEPAKPPETK